MDNFRLEDLARPENYLPLAMVVGGAFVFLILLRLAGGMSHLPTLVLQEFHVSTTPHQGRFVIIAGRPSGLISLLLSILGLGTKVRFEVSKESVQRELTKSHLHIIDSVPLPNVASTTYGYSKQVFYLVLALLTLLMALAAVAVAVMVAVGRGPQEGVILAGVGAGFIFFTSLVFFVIYHMSTRLEIGIETNGGRYIGVRFKPSIIGSLSVDLKEAAQAVEIINSLIR